MKKIYLYVIMLFLFCITSVCFESCKKEGFLGATSTTNLTQQTIFTDSANAEGFLANIYSNVGFAVSPTRFYYTTPALTTIPCGGLDAACDESEISHTYSTAALSFALGSINSGNVPDGFASSGNQADAFYVCYQQIRAVNQIFANISKVPLKSANKTQMLAEARFLRAWYYFILLEHYGGVPIIGNSVYNYTTTIPTVRNTFAQCVTYITTQCDTAAQALPVVQSGLNYGRASGGACLALKARVLLYAASPLFNKPSTATNEAPSDIASATVRPLVGYPTYDATRWATAEAAAQAVIQTNDYQLFTDSTYLPGYGEEIPFQYLFTIRGNQGNVINNEYIFQLMFPANDYLEDLFQPPSRTGANGAFPYQGTVDAFPMANGKAITDPTSGYDPTNPYTGRDPRLNCTITYDQSLMGVRTQYGQINGYSPVDIYLTNTAGTLSGGTDAIYQGTPTGYYNNKMLDPNACANGLLHNATARCLPLMRYADILLDYAEAANENEGPTTLVYSAVNAIRQRAGLNPYQLPTGLTQAQMRAAIQTERQCELAYEGYRFFDVRRWLIADQTENLECQGMEVDRTATAATYKIIPVRQHNFTTKMYLWPFPQAEVGKGGGLLQNPGY